MCDDPIKATQLCNGINSNTTVANLSCNGRMWHVGACMSNPSLPFEIQASLDVTSGCQCESMSYAVRPCINNPNWGGINGSICSGVSQDMEVICHR